MYDCIQNTTIGLPAGQLLVFNLLRGWIFSFWCGWDNYRSINSRVFIILRCIATLIMLNVSAGSHFGLSCQCCNALRSCLGFFQFLPHASRVRFLVMSMTFLFVPKMSLEPLNILRQIHWEDVFGPSLGRVWMSRSKSRSPGTKLGKLLRHSHWQCIVRCCIRRMLQMMSSSNRLHHSITAGGDGSARWRRLACGVCLVKHL